jgi:quinol monooxygenase YgiN
VRAALRLLIAGVVALGVVGSVLGQEGGAVFVVTYIEAAPSAMAQTQELLAAYSKSSRSDAGNVQFEALQRAGRQNHFALVEEWSNAAALERHAGSAETERFTSALTPLLYSPPDRRVHSGLVTGPRRESGTEALYVLTHIDVFPPSVAQVVESLQALARASRAEAGNLRFDALVTERKNHMTLIEAWQSTDAEAAHLGSVHNRSFRASLAAVQGALYDERLYRPIR